MIHKFKIIGLLGILTVIIANSCSDSNVRTVENNNLFHLKASSETGIKFNNTIEQTTHLNYLTYNYLLNGGGVATADFNNDGLPDIYFTGNQVDDKLYINQGGLKFKDVSKKANIYPYKKLGLKSWSSGATVVDINNDGWMDIYVSKSGPYKGKTEKQNLLFINNKDLTFSESGKVYGINDPGFSTQATFFDYDRDGDLDLFVLNHSIHFFKSIRKINQISKNKKEVNDLTSNLYRNDGGKFVKVTADLGLINHAFSLGVVASDYDNDGWVDLYVTNDFATPDYLYKNQGGEYFEEVLSQSTKHISFFSMGVDMGDINNDGFVDINTVDMTPPDQKRSKRLMAPMNPEKFNRLHDDYGFQYQYMINSMQLNRGNGKFSDISSMAGISKTDWSWSTLLADFDNDGWKDLFITNGYLVDALDNDLNNKIAELKENNQNGIPDKDKKEWLEKVRSQKLKNYIFRNKGDLTFEKMNKNWGLNELTFSNGASYSDLDLDGDLDLIINNINDPAYIYENTSNEKNQNNYIKIKPTSLSDALNAKVTVYSPSQQQYSDFTLTRGFQSSVEPILYFGLGNDEVVDSIKIAWIDGTVQILKNMEVNKVLEINKSSHTLLKTTNASLYFKEIPPPLDISYRHIENEFDDYRYELLLPHKNSRYGPFISVADVNNDGKEDFFISGAVGQVGSLYLQNKEGTFNLSKSQPWKEHKASEDLGNVFFDYDNDGDQDLYIISGGNEFAYDSENLQDRFYVNQGNGNFKYNKSILPTMNSSGYCVLADDFNNDGKLDLFVGGRMKPGNYPYPSNSYILIQENGVFRDMTNEFFSDLSSIGLITDATSDDINKDGLMDLIIVGEWMSPHILMNQGNHFEDKTPKKLLGEKGWWNRIIKTDLDNDGNSEYILGNLGLNYKYKASKEKPFQVYTNDFDNNGNLDIVLGYISEDSISYPVRGKECSSQQMPFIKDKFPTFKSFSEATLIDIYGEKLNSSLKLTATNFNSSILSSKNGDFELKALPNEVQISCTNAILVNDYNSDGIQDILLAGNMHEVEIESVRNDAGTGVLLLGGNNNSTIPANFVTSGFFADKDVKDMAKITIKGDKYIIVANNNGPCQFFKSLK